jgi:hypothetical protein
MVNGQFPIYLCARKSCAGMGDYHVEGEKLGVRKDGGRPIACWGSSEKGNHGWVASTGLVASSGGSRIPESGSSVSSESDEGDSKPYPKAVGQFRGGTPAPVSVEGKRSRWMVARGK